MPFIYPRFTEAEAKFVVVFRPWYNRQNLSGANIANSHNIVANLRPDVGIFRNLHITSRIGVFTNETSRNATWHQQEKNEEKTRHAPNQAKNILGYCRKKKNEYQRLFFIQIV